MLQKIADLKGFSFEHRAAACCSTGPFRECRSSKLRSTNAKLPSLHPSTRFQPLIVTQQSADKLAPQTLVQTLSASARQTRRLVRLSVRLLQRSRLKDEIDRLRQSREILR